MHIIGNLTKDPENRKTQSGISVCSFTVAVNKRKKDKDGNDLPAMFYRVTAWRQLADICGKYLKKGSKVYADGDLSVSTYQRNDGSTGFSLEIEAQDVEFLSNSQNQTQEQPAQQIHAVQNPQNQQGKQIGFTEVQVPEDELPF